MELPTSNRKKLLTFDWRVLSQKTTLFPFFGRSYFGNRSTYIAENFHIIFLGIICKCAKFHRNRRGDSQTIGWSDTEWPSCVLGSLAGFPTLSHSSVSSWQTSIPSIRRCIFQCGVQRLREKAHPTENGRITVDHPRSGDTWDRACELCHRSVAHTEKKE